MSEQKTNEKLVLDSEVRKCGNLILQALEQHHDAVVGQVCTIVEATLPDDVQCSAAKRLVKQQIREEQDLVVKYIRFLVYENYRASYNRESNNLK